MAHPLSGADLGTLFRAFRDGGAPDRWIAAGAILGATIGRAPISLAEQMLMRPKLSRRPIDPPVFILGHWRSGTTHLYNIMSLGHFGYVPPIAVGLPWDMFGIGTALRPLLEKALPEHRWIDRIPVTPTSPQEDEIGLASMSELSFYHGIYFPKRFDHLIDRGLFFDGATPSQVARWEERFVYFMSKLAHQQGKPLLIKNPVYTGRVARLRRIFPGAKFIHIHRNPFDVFLSMRNFYARLLEVMALQDVPAELDIDATILRVYDRMMQRFQEDTRDLAAPDFVEIPYQQLDMAPLDALSEIYTRLEIDGFDEARPAFETYLRSVETFEKNKFKGDAQVVEKVESHWSQWLARWHYARPEMNSA